MNCNENNLVIFFGDTDQYLSTIALSHDSTAQLLDHSNYKEFLNSNHFTTVYTSLGDLPNNLDIVYRILCKATTIIYAPPSQWSDNKVVDIDDPASSIHGLSEVLLLLLPESIRIENFSATIPADPINLVDIRKTNAPQLWIAGCSTSHGVGVENNQRYGSLLADELGLPCSFLTRHGAAIDWAADQILRSDIRKDDIVIWGITGPERLTYIYNNSLLSGVNISSYSQYPEYKSIIDPKNLYSQNTIFKHCYAIQQVINYCKKIGAKLLLVGIHHGGYGLLSFLKAQENYIHIPYTLEFDKKNIRLRFIDYASDNSHPGPLQHQKYKDTILKHLVP